MADDPKLDEPIKIGPHLLGRLPNKPDERDWTPEKLHQKLTVDHKKPPVAPPDATLDKTIRQAVTDRDPFVTTWQGILALWRWIKSVLFPPKPTPTPPGPIPTPTDGPLWADAIVLDQGNFGTCVGNAWAGWGNAAPVIDNFNETDARAIYYESTCIGGSCDVCPGPNQGTIICCRVPLQAEPSLSTIL